MEIKILKEDKDMIEVEIDNLTLVEVLRAYLNKDDSVTLAVWRREHPTKNPILRVEGKNPKKLIQKSIERIEKELDKAEKEFKDLK